MLFSIFHKKVGSFVLNLNEQLSHDIIKHLSCISLLFLLFLEFVLYLFLQQQMILL